MAKFNKKDNTTANKSGCVAYKMQDKEKLMTMVFTTMFGEPKYYGDNSNELVQLAEKSDMEFVAKLAVYARKEMNLRSVSHVLACIVAKYGKEYTRKVIHGAIQRPDDILEIFACYNNLYGKPFPNAMKRQIAIEMHKFNEYQYSKYKGGKHEFTFKDILRITHPVPKTDTQSMIYHRIKEDTLRTPYTWETQLSERGNTKEVWEELIDSGKIGYMAMLRNLRNIISADPKNLNKVYDFLSNEDNVKKSKQLPFRFYSAYCALKGFGTSKTIDCLEDAIKASTKNLSKIMGRTLIAIDVSGSMGGRASSKSKMTCSGIASVIGSIANELCEDSSIVTFDYTAKEKTISKRHGILYNADHFNSCSGGTNIPSVIEWLLYRGSVYDRVIIISDNECNYDSPWYHSGMRSTKFQNLVKKYRKKYNKDFWVHGIDIQGYGTQQFIGEKTNVIAGWSEKVLEFIPLVEHGFSKQVKAVEDYEI